MALSEQEKQILQHGKETGKSRVEVLDAISNYRKTVKTEPQRQGFLAETGQDLLETGSRVVGEFGQAGENIVDTATNTNLSLGQKIRGIGSEVFRRPARALGEVIVGAGKALLPQRAEESIAKTVGDVAESVISTEPVQNVIAAYQGLPEDTQREIDNALGFTEGLAEIVGLGAAKRVSQPAIKTAKTVVSRTKDMVEEGVDQATRVRRINKITSARESLDDTIGQIVQGEIADRPAAIRALGDIDTSGIKTYEELSGTMADKITVLSRELDDFLAQQEGVIKPEQITTATRVGGEVINQNFVDEALEHLDEMYDKVGEPAKRAEINQIKTKFRNEGLTPLELNNLAREYGITFKRKAFSKKGDPLTSVNAQRYENTRRGIKEAVRGSIEGDIPREIDAKISDIYSTKFLVDDMVKKVNRLQQKVEERGLLQNIARLAGKAVNTVALGTPQGFLTAFIPSNVGNKTLNSLDLQSALSKNLRLVNTALESSDDEVIARAITDAIATTQASQ